MIDRIDYIQRKLSFKDLEDLIHNNVVVGRFVDMYAHGDIVSKEEALYQMVRELAKSREELIREQINHMTMQTSLKLIKPSD